MSNVNINPKNYLNDVVTNTERATKRGTPITKNGSEMDKNAFLRILTAELANQDPENAKDSTQYITQMAVFAGLEQMANLNNSLNFSAASNLVGKTVQLNSYDINGVLHSGVVESISKNGSNVNLIVRVKDGLNPEYMEFSMKDVLRIYNTESNTPNNDYINNFLLTTSLIGQDVRVVSDGKDCDVYSGKVKSVFRTLDGIKLKIEVTNKEYGRVLKPSAGDSKGNNITIKGAYNSEEEQFLQIRYLKDLDRYEYCCLDTNNEWKPLTDDTVVSGVTVTKPNQNPSEDVFWRINLKKSVVPETREAHVEELLQVGNEER